MAYPEGFSLTKFLPQRAEVDKKRGRKLTSSVASLRPYESLLRVRGWHFRGFGG
jgi:hypothetical protein